MFFKRKDLPESNDFVLCTVKKILHHSVFVSLDEYANLEGLIHISEIAPGRIRNIRDYVVPDKRIVCKVLKVNNENKQVDLSLRRVSVTSMKNKMEEYRQEEKAEKILEFVGKQLSLDLEKTYNEAGLKIIEEFGNLQDGFTQIAQSKEELLKKIGVNEKLANALTKLVKEKIKPPKIKIKITLDLKSYEQNGVELVKNLLNLSYDNFKKKGFDINIFYVSAPKYQLELITEDKKNGDNLAENLANEIIKDCKKMNIIGTWQKAS